MESPESQDSKDAKTIDHDTGTSEIANHVEISPTISSHGQTSSSGNDQAMAVQLRHGNVDEQQPQLDNVGEQQPGNNAVMDPCSSRQALLNQIENVPNFPMVQQNQQLLNNDLNPRLPANEPRNGLHDQPPQIRPRRPPLYPRRGIAMNSGPIRHKIPHFHFIFGDQYWTFNDFSQRIPIRERQRPPSSERQQARERPRPPARQHPRPQANVCHRLPMNERQHHSMNNQPSPVRTHPPPLVYRSEIEPGIFEEIYSYRKLRMDRPRMFGVNRCVCQNYVNFNRGNNEMITVIMNTPNLTARYSMTTSREAQFSELFKAYYGLTRETENTIFVACGKRLREEDTPRMIRMKNRENIYAFVNARDYYVSKNIKDVPK